MVDVADRANVAIRESGHNIAQPPIHPPLAALGEDGLKVAFNERAGVLEVLFGVGLGGGEAGKRLVQYADDPLLFGERGAKYVEVAHLRERNILLRNSALEFFDLL